MQDLEVSIERAQGLKPDFILVSDYERVSRGRSAGKAGAGIGRKLSRVR
jgi:hypothetical protein